MKSLATHAADVQKQTQALTSEFGPSAEIIKKFADTTASNLGISAHEAESTANRFGLLFSQLHIGQGEAAKMTVNLEELVGAISQIRNVDPEKFFAAIPLALAGNTRGLRQLGIATDQQTIKNVALLQGHYKVGEQLTATAKAQAVYAIATENLTQRLQEAQAHSGDFANEVRKLKAEFDNQKDALGKGLLPALSKLGHVLIEVMPGAFAAIKGSVVALTDVLQTAYHVLDAISGPIGGAKKAIEAFVAALAVKKIYDFVSGFGKIKDAAGPTTKAMASSLASIDTNLANLRSTAGVAATGTTEDLGAIGAGAKTLATSVGTATAQIKEDFAQVVAAAQAASAEIDASLKAQAGESVTTLTQRQGNILRGLTGNTTPSGAREFKSHANFAPEQQRFAQVRPAFSSGGQSTFLSGITSDESRFKTATATMETEAKSVTQKIKGSFTTAFSGISTAAKTTADTTKATFAALGTSMVAGAEVVGTGFKSVFTGIKAAAVATADGIKAAFITALPILAITIAIQLIIDHFKLIKQVFFDVVAGIEHSWDGLKDVLIGTAKVIGGAMATYLTLPLRAFLEAASKVTGILDKIGIHIGGSVTKALSGLKSISTTFASEGAAQAAKGASEIGKAFSDAFKSKTDPNDPNSIGKKVKKASELSIPELKVSLQNIKDAIDGGVKVNSDAVTNAKNRLNELGTELAQAIVNEATDVYNAVNSAKSNLLSLSDSLAQTVGTLLDAPINAIQSKLNKAQDQLTLQNLRKQVQLPGGKGLSSDPQKALAQLRNLAAHAGSINKGAIDAFTLQYQQAVLKLQQDNANIAKQTTQKNLDDLALQLSNHQITLAQFKRKVLAVLKNDKIPYQEAGQILGQYVIAGFNRQTQDLFAQAKDILKAPNVKGTSPFAQQIIDPLKTLHADQQKIAKINQEIKTGQETLKHAIEVRAEKAFKEAQKQTKLHQQEVVLLQELHQLEQHQATIRRRAAQTLLKNSGGKGAREAALLATLVG